MVPWREMAGEIIIVWRPQTRKKSTWVLSDISESENHSIVSDSVTPMDYTVHGILQVKILKWVQGGLQGVSPTQGSNPGPPHCR